MHKKHSKQPTRPAHKKQPRFYEGYYYSGADEDGNPQPHLMAYMTPHEHVQGGFSAVIHGKPAFYTLHFIPCDNHQDKHAWAITRKLAAKLK